jgi:hypothetical protein
MRAHTGALSADLQQLGDRNSYTEGIRKRQTAVITVISLVIACGVFNLVLSLGSSAEPLPQEVSSQPGAQVFNVHSCTLSQATADSFSAKGCIYPLRVLHETTTAAGA